MNNHMTTVNNASTVTTAPIVPIVHAADTVTNAHSDNTAYSVNNAPTAPIVHNADTVNNDSTAHSVPSASNGFMATRAGDATVRVIVAHDGIGFDGLVDRDVDERLRELRTLAGAGKFMRRTDDFFLGSIMKAYREEKAENGDTVSGVLARWDDRAKEILTMANSRAVYKTANIMYNQMNLGSDRDELVAEGMRGLARAMKDYDPTTGYKFLTYATMWVRQHIQRHGRDIARITRLPLSQIGKMSRVDNRVREIRERGENVDSTMFSRILEDEHMSKADYLKIRAFNTVAESTDAQAYVRETSDGSYTSTSDVMDANKYELTSMGEKPSDPSDLVETESFMDTIRDAIHSLTPEEESIIHALYYDSIMTSNGERPMTMTKAREQLGFKRREFEKLMVSAKTKLHDTLKDNPTIIEQYQNASANATAANTTGTTEA